MIITILPLIAGFLVSFILTFLLWRFPLKNFLDSSSDRSLHVGVIPRSGGIAILLALVVALSFSTNGVQSLLTLSGMAALLALVLVSLLDDARPVPPLWRLLVQIAVAATIVFAGDVYFMSGDSFPLLSFQVVTVLGLVWLINLYNFMDGMDGFASGMALFGFGTYGLLGILHNDIHYAAWNFCVVVAVAGFWCWNFPPARIFMGDSGATLLGALAGVMALSGIQRGLFPLWVPVLVFSPFWVDASYTLLCRMVEGERFWTPHRRHFYQRLVSDGLGHRPVVLAEYLLMFLCALTAILPPLIGVDYNGYPPMAWGIFYVWFLVGLERYLSRARDKTDAESKQGKK